MKPETRFKITALQRLRSIPRSYFEKIQQVGIRGTPDILGVVAGHSVAIELKVDASVEALQEYKLSKWEKAGSIVFIMTPDTIDDYVEELTMLSLLEEVERSHG